MDEIKIGNLSDLTFVEIIALNVLTEYSKSLKRFTLYNMVNDFIKSELTTSLSLKENHEFLDKLINNSKRRNNITISTSSFYNSLSNLEKKGLISFNLNKEGKILTVGPSPLTRTALNTLLQYFIINSIIPEPIEFDQTLTEQIKLFSGKEYVENIYTIWFSEYIKFRLVELFQTLSDDVYILSKKEDYGEYLKMGLRNVHFSQVLKSKFREPEDLIDLVVLFNYSRNVDFFGMNRISVLKESLRILKPNGFVVIVTKADFSEMEDNPSINQVLNIYRNAIEDTIFSKEQLKTDMEKAGFIKSKLFQYQGNLIGLGWKTT